MENEFRTDLEKSILVSIKDNLLTDSDFDSIEDFILVSKVHIADCIYDIVVNEKGSSHFHLFSFRIYSDFSHSYKKFFLTSSMLNAINNFNK